MNVLLTEQNLFVDWSNTSHPYSRMIDIALKAYPPLHHRLHSHINAVGPCSGQWCTLGVK